MDMSSTKIDEHLHNGKIFIYLSFQLLLYTSQWYMYIFWTVCFLATWYGKRDQRTEVFRTRITIFQNEANVGYLFLRRRYVKFISSTEPEMENMMT